MKTNIPDRDLIISRCKDSYACKEEFARLVAAETYEDFWRVIVSSYGWCYEKYILYGITHPDNYEFITELHHANLRWFAGDLPKLKSVVQGLDLRYATGDLPKLETVGMDLYLTNYSGNLPSLKTVGGDLYLNEYSDDLPNLQSVGGWLFLTGYSGDLPKLKSVGGGLDVEGYTGNFTSLETVNGEQYIK